MRMSKVPFDSSNYLTVEALEDGLIVTSCNTLEYGIDGQGWTKIHTRENTPSINAGQTISFRGEAIPNASYGIGTFIINKKCNLKGNCMSILFGDDADYNFSLSGKDYAFYKLFISCTNIVNVSSNFLPATTLADSCYSYMFYGCTSLTTAPELPATTLFANCYYNMFCRCTSLTTAPELPATTLADSCYSYMFYGCTSLTTAPELPATTLADSCYLGMFLDCSKLNYIKMLATDISATDCLTHWVRRVATTGTFVKAASMTSLPTAISSNNYAGIPSDWTVQNA